MIVKQMRVGPIAVFSYIVGCDQEKEGLIIHYGDRPVSTLAHERETNPYVTDFLA